MLSHIAWDYGPPMGTISTDFGSTSFMWHDPCEFMTSSVWVMVYNVDFASHGYNCPLNRIDWGSSWINRSLYNSRFFSIACCSSYLCCLRSTSIQLFSFYLPLENPGCPLLFQAIDLNICLTRAPNLLDNLQSSLPLWMPTFWFNQWSLQWSKCCV